MNSWIILVFAGLFEMAWVLALKFSNNFSNIFLHSTFCNIHDFKFSIVIYFF